MPLKPYFLILLLLNLGAVYGQPAQTIDFYLTPSLAEDILNSKGAFVKEFLEKETGITIRMNIPKSYDELIEDFGAQKACFAMMNSQSYVRANTKYGALVKLRTIRFGHSTYQGMLITHAASGIKTLKDLQGKTIVYTDELSTSGYLYPKKLLEKSSIKTGKESFAKKHDDVVRQVYERKVDAGAAFYSAPAPNGTLRDARSRIKDRYPDVEKKVVVLITTDPIPNDPIVFSKSFDPATANKLCMALMKLAQDEKGKQALQDLYGVEGFVKASDADYNSLRQVMGVANK